MADKNINVTLRKEKGKNANRQLRRDGFIPAVIYSHGETESVSVSQKDFFKLFKGHISESVIFDVKISNKKEDSEYMAFVKDYQRDPITGELVHVDLFKVTKGEKIHTQVPVELVGTAIGTKMGGILETELREIEVECLPKDLPEKIIVDISNLDIGASIHVGDIEVSEGVAILSNIESVLAAVHAPRAVEIEEEEAEEEEVAEGEEPTEGEAEETAKEEKETDSEQ